MAKQHDIRYFDLNELLEELEVQRPGIEERIKKHLKNWDIKFDLIRGRLSHMNLFFYGVGEEYPIVYPEPYSVKEDIENSKENHPEAFITGSPENELRIDLNLIWYMCDVSDEEVECLYIMA